MRVLTHGAKLLPQTRAKEEEREEAERGDEGVGDDRDPDLHALKMEAELDEIVDRVLDGAQVHRVPEPIALWKHHRRVVERDDRSDREEKEKLVEAVREESRDETGHHLAPLRAVEEGAGGNPEEDRDAHHRCSESADPRNPPFHDQDRPDLARHGADHDPEIQPQTGENGNEEREHQDRVPSDAHQHLAQEKGGRDLRDHDAEDAERQEEKRDEVAEHPRHQALPTRVSA